MFVFLAVVTLHANEFAVLSCGLSDSTIFSTLSRKQHDLKKGGLLNVKCVLIFPKPSV